MLQVTPRAVEHIARVREIRNSQGEVPRLVGNGALVGFQFVARPAADDQRVNSGGLPIYVAANVASALEQSILDARTDSGWDDVDTTLVVRLQPGARFTATSPG
jgi:Fe-S cluster assembly iron-binding protein IscA